MIPVMNESRVWFITGASSGFGRTIAEAALDRGDRVVATARDPGQLSELSADDGLHAIALDATDPAQRLSAVDQAVEKFGRIDALVNNAGRTQGEEVDLEQRPQLIVGRLLDSTYLGGDAIDNIRASLDQLTDELGLGRHRMSDRD
jgi:NADP-dependent 3-hydroxy acid dehydrogenase YdfG